MDENDFFARLAYQSSGACGPMVRNKNQEKRRKKKDLKRFKRVIPFSFSIFFPRQVLLVA